METATPLHEALAGRYRVEREIGAGGMATVFRARDVRHDRLVALKVFKPEVGEVLGAERFLAEIRVTANLQHPNLVPLFDSGEAGGHLYYVMPFIEGESLRARLDRERQLPVDEAIRIAVAISEALGYAHSHGVLHRDLKPENILLPGGSVDAKVLDFGVAKVIENEPVETSASSSEAPTFMTAAGMLIGTPAYMAPEQFQGAQPDTRTDVFSLGVLAYEMLTGELPFGRGSLGEVVLAQARGVPPMKDGHVPTATERAIRTALDPDPDRRPSSPEAFCHLIGASMGLG